MKENRIPDLILEKYHLGELPARAMKEVERILKEDPALRERLVQLRASNDEIIAKYSPAEMARNIGNRLRKAGASTGVPAGEKGFFGKLSRHVPAITGIAAAVVIIPVLFITIYFGQNDRLKGKDDLFIYRKTASGEETLRDGDTAKQGDVLQLAYMAGGKRYGAIFSIDGKGNLTWHFPASMQEDTKLEPGKKTLLAESYELDNAPAFERFFFITSGNRLVLSNIVRSASILAKDPGGSAGKSRELFNGNGVVIITLKKGE